MQYRSCVWWPSLLRLAPPFLAAMANTYFVAERKRNGCIKRSFIQRVVEGGHCQTISRPGQCHCYCGSECASDKGQATAIAVNPDNPQPRGMSLYQTRYHLAPKFQKPHQPWCRRPQLGWVVRGSGSRSVVRMRV